MNDSSGLGHHIATGAKWMILQRLTVRLIGLVSTIVLARLLVPGDFGIIALATSLHVVLDSLLELGFDSALIQNQADGRKRYNTAWTLSIIRGVFVATVLLLTAHAMADLYEDPRLVVVMNWLALVALVSGFQNICIVEFRKEFQFDREFHLLVWSKLAGFTVTMALAWFWRDYRALIAGIVAGRVVAVAISYVLRPYKPALSLTGSIQFLHFSSWLFINNITVIIKTRLDTFVVGKLAGTDALGHYSVGYEISNLTSTELISPISRVLFSGFAKMSGDRPRLARSFVSSLSAIAFLAAPIAVGIALTAGHIVGIFLGERWFAVVSLIKILTLYGLLNLTSANTGALYLALGRTDLIFWRNLPAMAVLIPGLIIGVKGYGVEGAAWALVVSAIVNFIANFWMVRRELGVGISMTIGAVWRPISAASVMFVVLSLVQQLWPMATGEARLIPQFIALAAIGASVYAISLLTLWRIAGRPAGAEQHALRLLVTFVSARLAKARRAPPATDVPKEQKML